MFTNLVPGGRAVRFAAALAATHSDTRALHQQLAGMPAAPPEHAVQHAAEACAGGLHISRHTKAREVRRSRLCAPARVPVACNSPSYYHNPLPSWQL